MIINLRGTSGSGKSTAINRLRLFLMESDWAEVSHHVEGRKQPLWVHYEHPVDGTSVAILGHYNTACGGCDTINGLDQIFDLVKRLSHDGFDLVLFEGLIVCSDANRIIELARTHPTQIVQFETSREDCLRGIRSRRTARGIPEDQPFKESVYRNVDAKMRTCERTAERIEEACGVGSVRRFSRDQVTDFLIDTVNELSKVTKP